MQTLGDLQKQLKEFDIEMKAIDDRIKKDLKDRFCCNCENFILDKKKTLEKEKKRTAGTAERTTRFHTGLCAFYDKEFTIEIQKRYKGTEKCFKIKK
jgi:translation elongation factor EF-Ts